MRRSAGHARRQGVLRIGLHLKFHAQFLARAAGLAFANHRQRRRTGLVHHGHQALKAQRLHQQRFQRGYVHHPIKRRGALVRRVKAQCAAFIAKYLHGQDRGGVLRIGPAAQGFKKVARGCVERIGAHIAMPAGRVTGLGIDQGHAQPFCRQLQGQRAADDAGATYANIERSCHAGHCRSGL